MEELDVFAAFSNFKRLERASFARTTVFICCESEFAVRVSLLIVQSLTLLLVFVDGILTNRELHSQLSFR